MTQTPKEALEQAISNIGGLTPLGKALGITIQSISGWDRVPAERAIAVEAATGVSRHDLRPDVFGPAPKKTRAA